MKMSVPLQKQVFHLVNTEFLHIVLINNSCFFCRALNNIHTDNGEKQPIDLWACLWCNVANGVPTLSSKLPTD